jgi:peptidoglycan/LPS O-acetylase OafA/YrhL
MPKNNFDFLRFVFAFSVILAHIHDLTINQQAFPAGKYVDSFIAVSGFFIISGFLITLSYSRRKSFSDYIVKRARRIMPAYIFVIVICSILLAAVSSLNVVEYFTNPSFYQYLLANLVFLNFIHPCLPGVFNQNYSCAVDGSLWTLKVEVAFYLILPLVYYIVNKWRKKWPALVTLYILCLLYNYALYGWFQHHPNPGLYFTLSHQLPSLMSYFLAGMVIYFYFDKILSHKRLLFWIAVPVYALEYYWGLQVLRPLALTLIIFYVAYSFNFLNDFGKYGDFSYGIYIFHFPVIQLFIHYGIYQNYPAWLSVGFTLLISLVLGVLSWNLVEKRFLTRARVSHYNGKPV